ncbi:MAG: ATP-binding cassette domain-containing protein, partial [Candidatus Thorarchaeota archaeon]
MPDLPQTDMRHSLVQLVDIRTHFYLDEGVLKAVDGVTLSVRPEETLGLIGESGCGKSVTALSILRLIPPPGRLVSGKVLLRLDGSVVDLAQMEPNGREIRKIRGKEVAMVFQEPMTSLSPVHTIGDQICEAILLHRTRDKQEAREIALDMLERV